MSSRNIPVLRTQPQGVTQMVKNEKQHIEKTRAKQGFPADSPEPYKIAASTPFDFGAKNLTPYGGLFPVSTMLEKLGFKKLIEETLTIHRIPRAMTIYQFLLGMVLAIYVGFSRLNHLRFVAQDPMLTGILQVGTLPPQCTFWRFLTSLPVTVAQQLLKLQRLLRERVWEAANVRLPSMRSTRLPSSSWRARPRVCWKSWKRPTGGPRRRRTPTNNASFSISPRVGGRPIGSSLCAT